MKVLSMMICAGVLLYAGCQSADPASRSNRTAYRDIYAELNGSSNVVNISVGDGLYADASGGGDSQENTATQTTDTKPEVAVGLGGGSAGTGGASPTSGIVGEALNKLMAYLGGNKSSTLTTEEAAALTQCVEGACGE